MGVPGLWDILRPAGKQRSLAQLAVHDGFMRNPGGRRGLRVGIDASIWFFHATYGREGENPELRTLFFRCARLMSKPFLPLFVFDGPHRPELKRKKKVSGKDHWMVSGMQEIIEAFGFEWWLAPGEAEAELACLNRTGVIDAIITDDVDTFLFGATMVIRNPGKMLSGNSAHPVKNTAGKDDGEHTYVYTSADIMEHPDVSLSQDELILIALLRGGDYDPDGLDRCGVGVAHALARCGFGEKLLSAARNLPRSRLPAFLDGWRNEVRAELRSNARGFLNSKKLQLSKTFPDTFPNIDVLQLYTHPVTSERKKERIQFLWDREPDLMKLAALCERKFEWGVREIIIKRFRTVMWAPVVLRIMRRAVLDAEAAGPSTPRKKKAVNDRGTPPGTPSKMITRHFSSFSVDEEDDSQRLIVGIHGKREHASTDGMPEYRLEIAPAQLVRLTAAGVQGFRVLLSQYRGDSDDEDDFDIDDEGEDGRTSKRKGAGPKNPPPEPESHLRVWMPACIVERVEPSMAAAYEGRVSEKERQKEEKAARKAARAAVGADSKTKASGKTSSTAAKPKEATLRRTGKEEEEEELSAGEDFGDVFNLPSNTKGKTKATATSTSRSKLPPKRMLHLYEEEEEESTKPRSYDPKSKVTPLTEATNSNSGRPSEAKSNSVSCTHQPSSGLSRHKTILDLLDERYSSTRATSSSTSISSPAKVNVQNIRPAAPKPFPMTKSDDDGRNREGQRETLVSRPVIPASRGYASKISVRQCATTRSDSEDSIHGSPKKSPRKDREHRSPSGSGPVRDKASALPADVFNRELAETITDSEEDFLVVDTDVDDRPASPSPVHRRSPGGTDSLSGILLGSPTQSRNAATSGRALSSVKPLISQKTDAAEVIEITSDSESDRDKPARLVKQTSKLGKKTSVKHVSPGHASRRVGTMFPVIKPKRRVVQRAALTKSDTSKSRRLVTPASTPDDVIEIL